MGRAHIEAGTRRRLLAAAALGLILRTAPSAFGDAYLGKHDWDSGPEPWTSQDGWTVLTTEPSGGHTGGWLRVTFTNTTASPGDSWSDVARTSASNLYAGVWNRNMVIQFDFLAEDVLPNALQVRWQSATNDYVWGYVITPPTNTAAWGTYSAPLGVWSQWDIDPFGSEEQFLADLASIDWIGVYVTRTGTDEQSYGVDDFGLPIPEPGELAMLAVALSTSLASMRRKRRQAARGSGGHA
jgi:hypothetical protein